MMDQFKQWYEDRHDYAKAWKDKIGGKVLGDFCTSVFDEKGHFFPRFDPAEKKTIKADTVILAVGQKTDLSFLPEDWGLKVTAAETLQVRTETGETSRKGIFAGGELALGPGSAVEAMASGRRAAAAIDKFLGGDGIIDRPSHIFEPRSQWMGEETEFSSKERVAM